MLQLLALLVVFLQACAQAAPTAESLGVKLDKRSGQATITLPDATYQASNYDIINDIYTFANIRFAAPPVGDLRWAKPAPAPKNSTLQDGSYGNACPQAQVNGLNFFGSGSDLPVGTAIDEFINFLAAPIESGGAEDCLFLDVYVPGSAVRDPSGSKLPVVHWIFGGGYTLGSKSFTEPIFPLYDGSGLISQSGNNIIFIASNYRLGAFGFLAGTTMEQQGQPNAGLLDQQAALQWTKDNIALFGGDPTEVTAMGESAGASSLLHHLVFEGGTVEPLFKRVVFQSPAFEPLFDRAGSLEASFRNFTQLAGCSDNTVACLRGLSSETLLAANSAMNAMAPVGTFAFGPAADGSLIRQTPILELASGNYWKDVDSAIVSHCSSESTLFVDGQVSTDSLFTTYIDSLFPNFARNDTLDDILLKQYPAVDAQNSPYHTEGDRVRAVLQDSSFTCNARFISQAYAGKTYNMQYALTPGWHATDLLPTFWSTGIATSVLGTALEAALPLLSTFSYSYKSYFTSFIRTGDPNTFRQTIGIPPTVSWPAADASGDQIQNVVSAGDFGFGLISDTENTRDTCQFWQDLYAGLTIAGGYSPPGAVVSNPYISNTSAASSNYQ